MGAPLVRRSVRTGGLLFVLASVQFIVAMAVVQQRYAGYSLTQNYISDLGAVNCGPFDGRFVCSPWHPVFNVATVVMGVLFILGALLLTTAFPNRPTRTIGLGLILLGGVGAIGVGLFPEDFNGMAHVVSALTAFGLSNLGLIVLGLAMFRDTRWAGYRAFTVICGLVGLTALILLAVGAYHWGPVFQAWGAGGIERTIVAPLLLWVVLASIHLLRIRAFAPRTVPGGGAV